jgi:hypothetical protein
LFPRQPIRTSQQLHLNSTISLTNDDKNGNNDPDLKLIRRPHPVNLPTYLLETLPFPSTSCTSPSKTPPSFLIVPRRGSCPELSGAPLLGNRCPVTKEQWLLLLKERMSTRR